MAAKMVAVPLNYLQLDKKLSYLIEFCAYTYVFKVKKYNGSTFSFIFFLFLEESNKAAKVAALLSIICKSKHDNHS